jgi:hypothetical protein
MKINLNKLERHILLNVICPLDTYWMKDDTKREILEALIKKLDPDGSFLEDGSPSRRLLDSFNSPEYNDFCKKV